MMRRVITPAPQELESRYGEDGDSAGLADALDLLKRAHIVIDVFEHIDADHDVELLISIWEKGAIRGADRVDPLLKASFKRQGRNVHPDDESAPLQLFHRRP